MSPTGGVPPDTRKCARSEVHARCGALEGRSPPAKSQCGWGCLVPGSVQEAPVWGNPRARASPAERRLGHRERYPATNLASRWCSQTSSKQGCPHLDTRPSSGPQTVQVASTEEPAWLVRPPVRQGGVALVPGSQGAGKTKSQGELPSTVQETGRLLVPGSQPAAAGPGGGYEPGRSPAGHGCPTRAPEHLPPSTPAGRKTTGPALAH